MLMVMIVLAIWTMLMLLVLMVVTVVLTVWPMLVLLVLMVVTVMLAVWPVLVLRSGDGQHRSGCRQLEQR